MQNSTSLPTLRAALTGGAVVVGWSAYDLSLVATTGSAYLFPALMPGYAVAILLATVVGAVCARGYRLSGACLAVSGAVAIFLKLYRSGLGWHLVCLPRAVAFLFAALLLATTIARRSRPVLWPAVGLGALAAAIFALVYTGEVTGLTVVTMSAGLALVICGMSPGAVVRRTGVATAVLFFLAYAAMMTHQGGKLLRADRSLAAKDSTAATRPNLILIVLDTVSARHLAPYGHERVTTPGIDAFVQQHAVRYTQARSVSSWTLPTHASIFTGLYPAQHGADHPRDFADGGDGPRSPIAGLFPSDPLRGDVPTLAERLAAAGYQTGAIVANNGYLSHAFGLDRGFEHYDDRGGTNFPSLLLVQLAGYSHHLRKGPRRAERITDLAIEWMDDPARRRPFFVFLNYMDAHGPYAPPPPHDDEFDPARPRDPIGYPRALFRLQYDRELRYLDEHVTRLLRAIEARGLMPDTAVIITSDHGEGFGEHGFWRHDLALYEEHIAVPLYIKAPGAPAPGVSDRPVSSPELYHLMLETVGLATVPAATGPSITAEWYQSPALTSAPEIQPDGGIPIDRDLIVWIDGRIKWIVSSKGEVSAYDLAADPGERRPLALSAAQIEQARGRAEAWWQAHPPIPRAARPAADLDPAVLDRLRNLGYVH